MIRLAEPLRFRYLLHLPDGRKVALRVGRHQLDVVLPGGVQHLIALIQEHGHRLFEIYVLTAVRCINRRLLVEPVGQRADHQVNVVPVEQLPVISDEVHVGVAHLERRNLFFPRLSHRLHVGAIRLFDDVYVPAAQTSGPKYCNSKVHIARLFASGETIAPRRMPVSRLPQSRSRSPPNRTLPPCVAATLGQVRGERRRCRRALWLQARLAVMT